MRKWIIIYRHKKEREKKMNDKIELGDEVEELITGFKGIVMAKAQYLTGCDQIAIQPQGINDGKFPASHWFDKSRIKILNKYVIDLSEPIKEEKPGCDISPPTI